MTYRRVLFVAVLTLSLLLLPLMVFGQHYIQDFERGKIDWSNGIIESSESIRPSMELAELALARAVAKRDAIKKARESLLDTIEKIQVDSKTLIKDLIGQNGEVREGLQFLIKKAPIVDLTYGEDGAVSATLALDLRGPFSELFLPKTIRTIKPFRQPMVPTVEEKPFTGLIIDCRGFNLISALAPLITDEDGYEVYGPAYVSRDHAIRNSVASYARDLETAKKFARISGNPLIIKGIRTAETGVSDVVISNADAAKIKGTARHLSLLQQCKVVIVID